ncbi:MAG TPA: hypothetical protein VMI33_20810 [Streptosporangiaceae bacterium]|nr:hypothetical protein [Streptosporangiaceae bacterium]
MRSLNHAALRGAVRNRAAARRPLARGAARLGAGLAAAALALAVVLPATGPAAGAASVAGAAPAAPQVAAGGGCHYQLINGVYQFVCTNTTGAPGGPGSGGGGGGGGGRSACTLTPLSQQQARFLGLPWPAPAGHTWDAITCPGAQPFGGVTLVNNATGAPAVTPQQLSQIAIGDLVIPDLPVKTAPPRGRDGLVGLPEWFWIPGAAWGAVKSPVIAAGPVWAQATAVPTEIIFRPGGGQPGVTCHGPGTAYQPAQPLSAQHTDCSYTYDQPSAGQPGNAYAASVTVLWNVSWVGSGGAGGTVAIGRPVSTPITLRVAAGEALVTSR